MKSHNHLQMLFLAGILLATGADQTAEAIDLTSSREVILPAAKCGKSCGASSGGYGGEQIADAAGDLSTPRRHPQQQGGSYGSVSVDNEGGSWDTHGSKGGNPFPSATDPYQDYNTNRGYETSPEYGMNQGMETGTVAPYGYAAESGRKQSFESVTASGIMTEAQLLPLLNEQGKAEYRQLSPEGKALALQIASQTSFIDKNLAIQDAKRRLDAGRRQGN